MNAARWDILQIEPLTNKEFKGVSIGRKNGLSFQVTQGQACHVITGRGQYIPSLKKLTPEK